MILNDIYTVLKQKNKNDINYKNNIEDIIKIIMGGIIFKRNYKL